MEKGTSIKTGLLTRFTQALMQKQSTDCFDAKTHGSVALGATAANHRGLGKDRFYASEFRLQFTKLRV